MAISENATPDSEAKRWFVLAIVGCLLYGGTTGSQPLDDTWAWNGSSFSKLAEPSSGVPRSGVAMAYDVARGRVVLHGGLAAGVTTVTHEWNGATWETKVGPSPTEERTGSIRVWRSTLLAVA